ncbi:copper-binding protein [Rivibacter subsaxonicus]|uniref:Copper binding protein CusF n=1 Tax=Rivibacter subsaxonicus TaxID=457575 RepID=A0A4Q7VG66_9BURK|nr:copper-binding protein [Rivibacter subsaxonicus]RZT94988.1 copper binding protein CusF [Rivibacter subsaxonicus]
MMKHRILRVLVLAGATLALPALAQTTDGEVRKVDKTQQRITLAHGEIKSLDLPAMTMAYRVKDPALLDGIQPGDKVKFSAEKINGQFTLTAIRKP